MKYNQLLNLIEERTSVRQFIDQDVTDADISNVLEAARFAPTSCNRQAWKIVVFRKGCIGHSMLAKANPGGRGFAEHAPVQLLIIVDLRTYWMPMEINFPVSDGSIAASYIMLSAQSLGLGTCWISWQTSEKMKDKIYKEMEIPHYYFPICVIAMGYATDRTSESIREPLSYYLFKKENL